jgi:hypothetical protein
MSSNEHLLDFFPDLIKVFSHNVGDISYISVFQKRRKKQNMETINIENVSEFWV